MINNKYINKNKYNMVKLKGYNDFLNESKEVLLNFIEKAIRETLVIDNKDSVKYTIDKISNYIDKNNPTKEVLLNFIEKVIRETLVIDNKDSVKYTIDKINKIYK